VKRFSIVEDSVDQRLLNADIEHSIVALCEPVLASLGFECVHLEFQGGSGKGILRIFIDHTDGVTVNDCASASRQLEAVLDVEDVLNGAYTLEVSSPGLDRPLGRRSDFERYNGKSVQITTRSPVQGQRRWSGALAGVDGDDVLMTVDGSTIVIPMADVKRANLKYEFDSQPPNGANRGR